MKFIPLLLFLLLSGSVKAQEAISRHGSRELSFVSYLIGIQQYDEAIYHINQLPINKYNSIDIVDSFCFLKAWVFYNLKQLDSSAFWFQRVSSNSHLYKNALFFASSDYVFLQKPDKARELLDKVPVNDSLAKQACNLQFAGLSLLKRDYTAFKKYSRNFGHSHYAFANSEIVLDDCYKSMISHNDKSMFLAGAFSAILPGSGKIYAGKPGEGISSFLLISFLAAIAAENYMKAGPKNFKTIGFGSLFTIFYIGNIYGSVISIKVAREEFYKKYDNTVALHIHVPLRTIYWQ